jgi:hypothetical protein
MISLIRDNCDFLKQGISLLERHSASSYVVNDQRTFGSSIGAHMRHVLDHYSSFLAGIDSGVVNYDARVRETLVETDRVSGIEQAKSIVERLKSSVNTTEDEVHSVSSVGRELQFLASHTVHHYALIAIASRMQGIIPPDTFGIAPSTLKYMQTADC